MPPGRALWKRQRTPPAQARVLAPRKRAPRFRLLRDVLGGLVIVGLVLAGLYVASDGAWPPMLAVESGSMMHPTDDTGYGRVGTIDVGDLVLVERLDDPGRQVRTWAQGGPERFGRPGDVIVYAPNADQPAPGSPGRANVSIIHRAMAYVEVAHGRDGSGTYRVHWTDGRALVFGAEGIYLPELGFSEEHGFSPAAGYKPRYSGFVTKGDNALTNPASDQAVNLSGLVEPSWIQGRVYAEVPWMGLARLATQSGQTNFEVPGWTRVGNAFAPLELWTCFFGALGLVVLVPLAWDTLRLWREHRRAARERRALETEQRAEQRGRETEPTEFEVVT